MFGMEGFGNVCLHYLLSLHRHQAAGNAQILRSDLPLLAE